MYKGDGVGGDGGTGTKAAAWAAEGRVTAARSREVAEPVAAAPAKWRGAAEPVAAARARSREEDSAEGCSPRRSPAASSHR